MKHIISLLLTGLLLISCGETATNQSTHQNESEQNTEASSYFYRRLEGTIADQPVVMHLHKTNNGYEGIYYYENIGQWLHLNVDSSSADSIYFSEYYLGEGWDGTGSGNARLVCKYENGLLKGVWISKDNQKTYPFELRAIYPQGSFQFELKQFEDSLIAFPGMQESSVARVDISSVMPKGNELLLRYVEKLLGFKLESTQNFKNTYRKYFEEYRQNLPSPEDNSVPMHVYNYFYSQAVLVRYNDNNLVMFEEKVYEYTGGAHGNYGSTLHCLDVAKNARLELSDIISADSATLQKIVEQQFRKQYKIGASEKLTKVLFEEHLALTRNFYLTGKGIGFLYNPYEVAAYAQGQIEVFVPFTVLKNHLTPAFRERLKIEG